MKRSTVPSNERLVEIVVCLGSSCFARGNSENLAIINQYVQSHALNVSVHLTGKLCQDQCKQGPNLIIDGKVHHNVTSAGLREVLQRLDVRSGGGDGTT
jgi:NADH:ubiquinone oxidoreductase subunit E